MHDIKYIRTHSEEFDKQQENAVEVTAQEISTR